MTNQATPKRGATPPKGKPTPARTHVPTDRRVFGPVSQWIAFVVLVILVFVVLVILTGGGDFSRFNQHGGMIVGQIAATAGL